MFLVLSHFFLIENGDVIGGGDSEHLLSTGHHDFLMFLHPSSDDTHVFFSDGVCFFFLKITRGISWWKLSFFNFDYFKVLMIGNYLHMMNTCAGGHEFSRRCKEIKRENRDLRHRGFHFVKSVVIEVSFSDCVCLKNSTRKFTKIMLSWTCKVSEYHIELFSKS